MYIFPFVLLGALAPSQSLVVRPVPAQEPLGYEASDRVPALVNDTVVLKSWYGRLGNNIIQMTNAIIWGSTQGATKVRLPTQGRNVPLFDLPDELEILDVGVNLSQLEAKCLLSRGTFFSRCPAVNKALFRDVAIKHLRPFLTPKVQERLEKEKGIGFDGLTVHLRGGDIMKISTRQAILAPCSYISRLLHTHNFTRVRVVSQDRSHPCTDALRSRLPNVKVSVQAGTLEEDAAALMSARNLAFLSGSTFSQTLELLSDQPRRTFMPIPHAAVLQKQFVRCKTFTSEPESALETLRHATFWSDIGTLDLKKPGRDRTRYMLMRRDPVQREIVCNSDFEVPFFNSFR